MGPSCQTSVAFTLARAEHASQMSSLRSAAEWSVFLARLPVVPHSKL